MNIVIITGSAGLIGSEAVRFFISKDFLVIGIDNDMRKYFFGAEASTSWNDHILSKEFPEKYISCNIDIRNEKDLTNIFCKYANDIKLVIHTAAQPSHDWAAKEPITDFTVNANGTLVLLEAVRKYSPCATFIFTSTNKVYGDLPNYLPLVEFETRWEIEENHKYYTGIDETMSIDQSKHSLFGVSKIAADVLVQEYGRYFGIKTAIFRGGCLTGGSHSGTELHGFLSYLMLCNLKNKKYNIFGYKGKQVRDNIHSYDLVNCFYQFFLNPRIGEVYNMGGSRFSNCSIFEAIDKCEKITGNKFIYEYFDKNREGDHIWYISDVGKFKRHYPKWEYKYNLDLILMDIYNSYTKRIKNEPALY